jgi:hypothetical protein
MSSSLSQLPAASSSVSVKLTADGKNWKDWIKQLTNYAAAENAFGVLDGKARPDFDPTHGQYAELPLTIPTPAATLSQAQKEAEYDRAHKTNKGLIIINNDNRRQLERDRAAHDNWVKADARLQNVILSSIDKALLPQVRDRVTAHAMYTALKELNNSGDYYNAALA